jgi:hypothetical protein
VLIFVAKEKRPLHSAAVLLRASQLIQLTDTPEIYAVDVASPENGKMSIERN